MSAPVVWVLVVALAGVAAPSLPAYVQTTAGRLQVELVLPKAVFAVGETVAVQLTARNTGEAPLRVRFASGQRFDVVVRRRGGPLVWRWSHDQAFIQVVSEVVLSPGESLGPFRVAWSQVDLQGRRIEPGEYEVVGSFLGQAREGEAPLQTPPLPFRIRD